MEKEIYIYKQQTIFQEQTWVSLTTISMNAFFVALNSGINKYLLISASICISCFAMYIILTRVMAFTNVNNEYSSKAHEDFSIRKAIVFIIKEKSGGLFYFVLVFCSMVGVIFSKFYFAEIIRNIMQCYK